MASGVTDLYEKTQDSQDVPPATLVIKGSGEQCEVKIPPTGAVFGREKSCDVVLDDSRVSRRHARMFCNPFGQWTIEDLGSHNGTLVEGQRVKTHAMVPGGQILIDPFTLWLKPTGSIIADATAKTANVVLEGAHADVIQRAEDAKVELSRARMNQLNTLGKRLASLPGSSRLYAEVCREMATEKQTAAAVLRLNTSDDPEPEVLACRFGGQKDDAETENDCACDLRLSKRVLQSVATSGRAVMGGGTGSPENASRQLQITMNDRQTPRAVYCAPIAEADDRREVLYFETTAAKAAPDLLDFVESVAHQVSLVRGSLLMAEARAERESLDRQLAVARKIQTGLTPNEPPDFPGTDVAFCYRPAMWVGGDYFDLWTVNDQLVFAVGDVMGKGLPAAMVMSNLQAALRATMLFCHEPAQALEHVNKLMARNLPRGMFITLYLGVFDPAIGRVQHVNAGHGQPILVSPDEEVTLLAKPPNAPVGVSGRAIVAETVELPPGAGLVIVTDGITEAQAPDGEMYGADRLTETIKNGPKASEPLIEYVRESVDAFLDGRHAQDDITMLALFHKANPDA